MTVIRIVGRAKDTCARAESHQFVMSGTAVTIDPKLDYMYPIHQGSSLFGDFLYSGQYDQENRQINISVLQKNVAVIINCSLCMILPDFLVECRYHLV